jgi:dTDP-4-dehydrorhamnose reductase
MNKVLVLGGSGLVGKSIINEMSKNKKFQIYSTYLKSSTTLNKDRSFKLDIEDTYNISSILDELKPEIVISCLRGDYDKQLILHTKVANYLKENDGKLYFFSTTNVFDNDLSRPHYEDDLPNSCTDYGQYKIECEKIITDILNDNAIILRLPQVWGKDSPRMNHLLKLLTNKENVVVYSKLLCNANIDTVIAKQLCYIIEHRLKGVFHLVSGDMVNQKEFCIELIKGLGFENVKIEENFEEEGYFVLLSKRINEFPEFLRLNNKDIINYLIDN